MGKLTELVEETLEQETIVEAKGSKEEWDTYRKVLKLTDRKESHLHPDFGLVYCPDCPAYGGKLKNITMNTDLSEMFCKKGFKEVVDHLKSLDKKLGK